MVVKGLPFLITSIFLGNLQQKPEHVSSLFLQVGTGIKVKGGLDSSMGLTMNLGAEAHKPERRASTLPMTTPLYLIKAVFKQHNSISMGHFSLGVLLK